MFLCQEKERLLQDMCGKEEKLNKEREAKDMLAKKIAVSDHYKQSRSFYKPSLLWPSSYKKMHDL